MAITGQWRRANMVSHADARVWGTGVNPVHARRGEFPRHFATHPMHDPYRSHLPAVSPEPIAVDPPDWGVTEEDSASAIYGYGFETGTAAHPNWASEPQQHRGAIREKDGIPYPSWGTRPSGIPGGNAVRTIDEGAEATLRTKQQQPDSTPGLFNKESEAHALTAQESAPSTVFVVTSLVQNAKKRQGSQRSGSLSQFNAGIAPRLPGMKETPYSGGYRHVEMQPREQGAAWRPFRTRTAGTGNPNWLQANRVRNPVTPITRVPPDLPYTGPDETDIMTAYAPGEHEYGFTAEDVVY